MENYTERKSGMRNAFMLLILFLALSIPGGQSECPFLGMSSVPDPDCVESTTATTTTTNTGNTTINELSNNYDAFENLWGKNETDNATDSTTTPPEKKTTTIKRTIVDPYDDEGRARREMIVSVVLPTIIGLIILVIAYLMYKAICKKPTDGETRCTQFWSSYGYHLPNPDPNQHMGVPMPYV